MSRKLFLTGTGTDVGKTYIAGLLLKKLHENGLSAAYYKAAMSGNDRRPDNSLIPGDALHVKTAAGLYQPLSEMCPYVYENAVSPHLAAQWEGNPVRMEKVLQGFAAVCRQYEYVLTEGSGGILCPLSWGEEELWLPDFIRSQGLGCLLVADAGLGTINYVGLTAYYMKAEGIPLKGMIFNYFEPGNPLHEDNVKMCEALTQAPVLACVSQGDTELSTPLDTLQSLFE